MGGNVEMVRLLAEFAEVHSRVTKLARGRLLKLAAREDRLSVMELFLELEYDRPSRLLISCVFRAPSVTMFENLFALTQETPVMKPYYHNFLQRKLVATAENGNMELMASFLQLYTTDSVGVSDDWKAHLASHNPVSAAAGQGRWDMVLYLLDQGFSPDQDTLESAVRFENSAILHIMLDKRELLPRQAPGQGDRERTRK
jgi:hypothetical protein